jgi:rhodanese-related sulfurtransferase
VKRRPVLLEWQSFPGMQRNQGFATVLTEALKELGTGPETPILFLCRSGGRSRAAAEEMSRHGYRACFNIEGGFEGDLDRLRRRGSTSGWKASGLPWVQS